THKRFTNGRASREREIGKTIHPGNRSKAHLAWLSCAVATLALMTPAIAFAAPLGFEAAGSAPADIQPAIAEFRSFLGGDDNKVGGSFQDGRREINWDGVPDRFVARNT